MSEDLDTAKGSPTTTKGSSVEVGLTTDEDLSTCSVTTAESSATGIDSPSIFNSKSGTSNKEGISKATPSTLSGSSLDTDSSSTFNSKSGTSNKEGTSKAGSSTPIISSLDVGSADSIAPTGSSLDTCSSTLY